MQGKVKDGKKKGKGKVKPTLSRTALRRQDNNTMRSALIYSAREAGVTMARGYRAIVETSESKEEEFLDRAMAEARDKSPCCEEESAMEGEEEARPDDTGSDS